MRFFKICSTQVRFCLKLLLYLQSCQIYTIIRICPEFHNSEETIDFFPRGCKKMKILVLYHFHHPNSLLVSYKISRNYYLKNPWGKNMFHSEWVYFDFSLSIAVCCFPYLHKGFGINIIRIWKSYYKLTVIIESKF